jgi:sarcosine oxidase
VAGRTYDVIVLGVGAMGSAAAFELARRGCRVLALEQFAPGHDRGSSHGQTRVIRKAYYEHPDYVPLLCRAYERWYDLEQRRGRRLFTECGVLSVGPTTGEVVAGVRSAAHEHRLPVENLTADELRRRYPVLRPDDGWEGVLEREAGFLDVEECVRAYADEAAALGADVRSGEAAVAWEVSSDSVTVRTARDVYSAARLVVTAGAWALRMLADLGLPLRVLRKTLHWFSTDDNRLFRRDVFPIYMLETPQGFYYGFPVIDPTGHKVARHDGGEATDPETVDREATEADAADCRNFLRARLPQAAGPLRRGKVCLYTVTPDHHFAIDVHPRHRQVSVACGFSGHGFKFASVVGEVMADLAEKGRTDLPIGRFALSRFACESSRL